MNYTLAIFELCKHLIPPHLQGGRVLNWVTGGGLFWATGSGAAWSSGTDSKQMAWIRVCLSQLQVLHDRFLAYVGVARYRMNITGQVVYLEHLLNDQLDSSQRRIYIDDGTDVIDPRFLYLKPNSSFILYNNAGNQPVDYLYNRADYLANYDFIIMVPSAIILSASTISLIRALVNAYRASGKTFTIQNF